MTSLRMERVWNYIYVYRTFQKMQQLETYSFNKNNIEKRIIIFLFEIKIIIDNFLN